MNFQRFIGATIFAAALCAPASKAQTAPSESDPQASSFREESKEGNISVVASAYCRKCESPEGRETSAVCFHKKQFLAFSAAVYAASLADMHQTMHVRNYSWWYETDPIARPIVRLPAPAYYATGLALATGVNWLSWKMGHSKRWRKLSPIPQLLTIVGNLYGFKTNRF